ncbi:Sir2 family NAD-dependent protein deacetylase [Actinomyces sp. F1_1611]
MITEALSALTGRRVAVLTGAGVSTGSGLPDYRGQDAPPRTPMTFQQFISEERYRRHYWARTYLGYQHMNERRPNVVHEALARWEYQPGSALVGIITQNIDTLHEKAGSGGRRPVIDLHGRFDRVLCRQCGHRFTREFVQGMLAHANPGFHELVGDVEIAPDADAVLEETDDFHLVVCPRCGGTLRPDVVFFGEVVPPARVAAATALVDEAEALLVLGSSLAVHSGLRYVTRAEGKPIVIINRGPTRGDRRASVKLDGDLAELVPPLLERLAPL